MQMYVNHYDRHVKLPDKEALKQQLLRWADESLGPRA